MAEQKKILLSLPYALVEEADAFAARDGESRSAFVREAIKFYMRERKRTVLRECMENGYREMGEINLRLANACLEADWEATIKYEENLR